MSALAAALALLLAAPVSAQDAGVRADAGRPDGGAAAAAVPDEVEEEVEEAELPEGHRPEVALRIDPREGLATGDLVHVIVTVRLPEGDDVNVPRQAFSSGGSAPGPGGGPFELHDQRHRDAPIDGGRREYTFEIDLLALEPGEHELPALRLRVITADGIVGTVTTEPQTITIGSLIANEPDAQPRPPTPPVPVMEDDYTLAWILGILGALVLTALITWLVARWWSRRPKAAPPPPPARPAWETALAKLDALRKKSTSMLEKGEHVALVDGVSDALREYLGARYGFNGLESTTDEIVARVKHVQLGGATVLEITALLSDCDLVKFAKAVPAQAQCDEMIAGAIRIVRGTMPSAMPAIAPPAAKIDGGRARDPKPREKAKPAPAPAPIPVTRVSERGQGIELPLVVERIDALDAVVSAAVMGVVGARAHDPAWDGSVLVKIGPELADEYAARMALRAVHEKIAKSVEGRRAGARVVIEHARPGGGASTYGPGIGEEKRGGEEKRAKEETPETAVPAVAPDAHDTLPSDTVPSVSGEPRMTPTGNAFDDEGGPGKGGSA